MEQQELLKVIETLFFITDQPLPLARLCKLAEVEDEEAVRSAIAALRNSYLESGRAMQIIEVGGGYQMSTKPEHGRWVRKLYNEKMTARLSNAAFETLAIIAYKQPLTRAEIEMIRGVDVIGPLETLIERALVKVVGRKETVGRPLLYGTTPEFLKLFGLRGVEDLPKFESFGVTPPKEEPNLFDGAAAQEQPEAQTEGAASEEISEEEQPEAAPSPEEQQPAEPAAAAEPAQSGELPQEKADV